MSRTAVEAGGWEVTKKYVQAGPGIAIVTSICPGPQDGLVSIPLTDYFPRHTYGLVLRHGRFLSPAARRLIDMMAPEALADITDDRKLSAPVRT